MKQNILRVNSVILPAFRCLEEGIWQRAACRNKKSRRRPALSWGAEGLGRAQLADGFIELAGSFEQVFVQFYRHGGTFLGKAVLF